MSPERRRGSATTNRTSPKNSTPEPRTEGKVTECGADTLIAHLDGVEGSDGHWKALCPVHKDTTTPNLHVDVREHDDRAVLFVHCKACCANGDTVCYKLGLQTQHVFHEGNEKYRQQKAKYIEPISEEKVRKYVECLFSESDLLAYLTDHRGLTPETLRQYEVGYDIQRDRYALPVRDAAGELVNFRRYLPDGPAGRKMINSAGHGKPARLYPDLPKGKIIVCEGEWDALVLRRHGFPAVTSTHGAGSFLDEWIPLIAGRKVAFLFDCDDAGRMFSADHACKVAKVARRVAVVDLDPSRSDKWDVSDWFNEGRTADELRALINAAFTAGRGQGLAS